MIPGESFSPAEHEFFERKLMPATRYLEFGMGWSSLRALAQPKIESLVCIEGSPEYAEAWCMQQPAIKAALVAGRLTMKIASTGLAFNNTLPDLKWREKGEHYSQGVLQAAGVAVDGKPVPDLALVDGRFRVACIAACVLLEIPSIIVHDFDNRPWYHHVLDFCEVLDVADTFVELRKKEGCNWAGVIAALEEGKCDPR